MDILAFLFPKRCVGCGRVGEYVCRLCAKRLPIIERTASICPCCHARAIDGVVHPRCSKPYGLNGLTCFFSYNGVVRSLIHEMKYRLVADLANAFVAQIPSESLTHVPFTIKNVPLVIVPIPLAPLRQKYRGFNQAELLANALGTRLGITVSNSALERLKETSPQAMQKHRFTRLQNMKHAFVVRKGVITGSAVILCDDVYTTGATMKNAASALKRAGIKYVWGVAMAR